MASITKKLLIREGNRVAALKAPPDFESVLGDATWSAMRLKRV